jgi:hypothetical protein
MNFQIKDGMRVAILRPKDPQAAIAHALKAQRTQRWSDYLGETTFIGYMAEGGGREVLNAEGVVIGTIKPGDIFAVPPEETN